MSVYKKIMDVIAGIEKVVLSVVLAFVTMITFANVLVRKLSNSQFAWTEELVINLFVLMIMKYHPFLPARHRFRRRGTITFWTNFPTLPPFPYSIRLSDMLKLKKYCVRGDEP